MKNTILLLYLCLLLTTGCKKNLEKIKVDCSNLPQLLTEIHKADQGIRTETDPSKIDFDLLKKSDFKNLGKVVSIIEQCGMPTSKEIDKQHIETIFYVIQHAKVKYMKEYFPLLEKAAENGDLKKSSLAKMTDRILINDNKPQIYGTQVKLNFETKISELYELENPESVEKRRREVGLGSLQEFLKEYDIEFDVEQVE